MVTPLVGAPPDSSAPMVEIRKLWTVFTSPERRFVVHEDLDLTVHRGEVLSLVGGSGTGKTVLLRQILGLETPSRGEIKVLEQPIESLGRRGAASRIGMLFQHGALFSAFTVLENIAFPLRELKTLTPTLIREAAMVKLQMVGLKPEDADRIDQAGGAGSGADHGSAPAAAGRADCRARSGQL
jgi:phospholipid/cholesterol/gamma-HCH transport system ATP-binding protein